MGQPKLSLPFGDETMLARVVRRLSEVVKPVVVCAAPGQDPSGPSAPGEGVTPPTSCRDHAVLVLLKGSLVDASASEVAHTTTTLGIEEPTRVLLIGILECR